jgi:proteasome accessory factor A
MAIPKVLGTETEFGVAVRGQPDFNPVMASSMVVNSFAGGQARIQWSLEEESPGRDARGFGVDAEPGPDMETGLVNAVLTNGARLYVDHAHPEYSSPECINPWQAALYDKAGESILALAAAESQRLLAVDERMLIHKNNSDGKGNSYGSHENYLMSRDLPFADIVKFFTTFLVTRQVFTGAGKVGSENGRPPVDYQLTQRADFFEEEVGLETTLKRPIINTRDEPHGDPTKYRRLHVIIGDANLSEVQTLLKLGTAALMLAAIEDGAIDETLRLSDPVAATWRVSHDTALTLPLDLAEGGNATAVELQWRYFEWASKYARTVDLDPSYDIVLAEWEKVLIDLEADPMSTADRLDWAAKRRLLMEYQDRDGLEWDDAKMRLLGLQYHDVDPQRSLYNKLSAAGRIRRIFSDEEVQQAVAEPPPETRAYFRGKCVARYSGSLVAANWDSLVFDVGEDTLKRVPMMEPLRGTRERTQSLLDASPDAASLVSSLGGDHGGAEEAAETANDRE